MSVGDAVSIMRGGIFEILLLAVLARVHVDGHGVGRPEQGLNAGGGRGQARAGRLRSQALRRRQRRRRQRAEHAAAILEHRANLREVDDDVDESQGQNEDDVQPRAQT